uniref:glycosyltransferase n=1 Tax=uncultured Clostridium sp. TaxID=59620 RepID=UPI0025F8DC94
DRYFIFDLKLDRFDEVIDFSEEALLNVDKYNYEDEFSDILLIDDFNIENAKKFIVGNNKKIYYYSLNIIKSLSFFKLPGILKYLERVRFFNSIKEIKNYFRNNLNTYIPHILLDSSDEKRKELQKTVNNILMQEHEFRLTKEGRCTNNILLSIGIPTWNRGNLALKNIKSLLRTPYDSEIEFVVSDNGSTQYTDEYLQIRNMNDSRVKYFRFDKNMGATINFANVMSIASGKYVLLLSDEDRVNLEVLGHYMNLLKNNENIALIRSSTDSMYINLSNQCFSAGYDALKNAFLTGNYISGIIYKKEIFNKYKLKDLYLKYKNNIAYKYYPHMFWDSVMALNGEFVTDSNTLIFHGKSVLQEQIAKGIAENDSEIKKNISVELDNMPLYVTYENRILQHYGFIELINNLNIDSIEMVILLYIKLCFKTNFLPSLVKDTYLNNGYDWNIIYNKILKCCIKGIEQLKVDLSVEQKELIKFYILKANNENR